MNKWYSWFISALFWLPYIVYCIYVKEDFGPLLGVLTICFIAGIIQLYIERRYSNVIIKNKLLKIITIITNITLVLFLIIYLLVRIIN